MFERRLGADMEKYAYRRRINFMKHLVIAEKPSVARDIARVLGCGKKTNK